MTFLAFIAIFVNPLAWSATNISVKFDHTFYQLEITKKKFVYDQAGFRIDMPLNSCQQKKVSVWEKDLVKLKKTYKNDKKTKPSTYDVVVLQNTKSQRVLRGTPYGTFLRDTPKEIPYLVGSLKTQCQGK